MSAAKTIHFARADEQQRDGFSRLCESVGVHQCDIEPPGTDDRLTAQLWMDPNRRTVVDQMAELYCISRSTMLRVAVTIGMAQILEYQRGQG